MADPGPQKTSRREFLLGSICVGAAGLTSKRAIQTAAATAPEPSWVFDVADSDAGDRPWLRTYDGVVYVGDRDRLYALDERTGEQLWQFENGGDRIGYSTGTVYTGTNDSERLHALDARTGEQRWETSIPARIWSSPSITDGRVYLTLADERFQVLDGETGEQHWQYEPEFGERIFTPTVTENGVYVSERNLTVLDPETGAVVDEFNFSDARLEHLVIDDDVIYALEETGSLVAINREEGGAVLGRATPEGELSGFPTVASENVYIGNEAGAVHCFEKRTLDQRWRFDTADRTISTLVRDGLVYTNRRGPRFYALDAADGSVRWSWDIGDRFLSFPRFVGESLVVADDAGDVYALNPDTGDQQWTFTVDAEHTQPRVRQSDHSVYVSDGSGRITAVPILDPPSLLVERIESESIEPGEELTVTAEVRNTGETEATLPLELEIGSIGTDSWRLTLSGGESTVVSSEFETDETDSGTHELVFATVTESWTEQIHVSATESGGNGDSNDGGSDQSSSDSDQDESSETNGEDGFATDTALAVGGGGVAVVLGVYGLLRVTGTNNSNERTHQQADAGTDAPDAPSPDQPTDSGTATGKTSAVSDQINDQPDSVTEDLHKQAENARTTRNIPETVPTTSRHSLPSDRIEKGEPIGSGGNADVYHATARTDDGKIELAIKEPRMSGTIHTETVERMLTEAETWQQLDDHDHIVSVVDYDSEPLPWIAMEYMDAGHIGERAGDLAFEQALWTAIATTKGVRHAHRRGVAHLDLKPENILFRSVEDAWDVPKVADWGLSKHLLNHSKSVEGLSPQYAAPEQFDGEFGTPDDITDVYQLGAVFYELFTGQPPFEGQPARLMNKVMKTTPTPPSELADVPDELDEILLTALAKEKTDRYESVLYIRDELQELFEHS